MKAIFRLLLRLIKHLYRSLIASRAGFLVLPTIEETGFLAMTLAIILMELKKPGFSEQILGLAMQHPFTNRVSTFVRMP
ncbi:hypothetical protein [Microcoleus sp. CAWBG58]|uniref:hypothetical protein n=1 Tax=Microcoleus sp. CAWBG58 TaxID=2841651 RepID=UPI0025D5C417|nr:hypothetical protein [Microcoleus sp. CAWBG58]